MPVTKYLCAIAIQKVQSYLFDAVQSHEQEKQTDAKTLRKIKRVSTSISECFAKVIKDKFGENMLEINVKNKTYFDLPAGSGCIMFVMKSSNDEPIDQDDIFRAKLVDFYNEQYGEHKAAMRISYAHIPLEESSYCTIADDKIILTEAANEQIKELKRLLKNPQITNHVIMAAKETIFVFQTDDKKHTASACSNNARHELTKEEQEELEEQTIAKQLEELRPDANSKSIHSQKEAPNGFYIAYIKADLSGMGEAFAKVSTLDGYITMSELLSKNINIAAIKEKFNASGKDIKFYPIYAAGDDIFIAVRVTDITQAVQCLTELLSDINRELRNHAIERFSDNGNVPIQLSMRIGIDITRSNQPIRYYYQRTESQMEQCRTISVGKLVGSGYALICIGNMVFWHIDKEAIVDSEYLLAYQYVLDFEDEKKKLREKHKEYRENTHKREYNTALKELKNTHVDYKDKESKTYEYYCKVSEKCLTVDGLLWNDYISDIQLINFLCGGELRKGYDATQNKRQDDKRAVTVSYLYNLLSVLESENTNNYLINALYRLMPPKIQNYGNLNIGQMQKYELIEETLVWHIIAKHFIDTKKEIDIKRNETTKKAKQLSYASSESVRRYIKLILLACDLRFLFDVGKINSGKFEYKVTEALGDLHDYYTKILDELYLSQGEKHPHIGAFFISKTGGFKDEKKKSYSDYIILSSVEKSMLYRFKTLLGKKDMLAKIASAIEKKVIAKEFAEKTSAEEVTDTTDKTTYQKKIEEENKQKRNTLNECFSVDKFTKSSNLSVSFTADFIDLLIVFYLYFEMRNKYKNIFGTKKNQGEIVNDYIKFKNIHQI